MRNFILGFLTGLVSLAAYGMFELKNNQLIITGVPVMVETTATGYSQSDRDEFTALIDKNR
jgi:hypothetical protein